jgi:predicted nucleotidyltransferase
MQIKDLGAFSPPITVMRRLLEKTMRPDIAEIAKEFALPEEVLITESVRAFLTEHLRQMEADRQARCAKFGVKTLEEMDGLLRRGEIDEDDILQDFQEVDYLTNRIRRIKVLLEDLPMAPKTPQPTLDQIRQTLKAQMPSLAETYDVKSLGIFGPYATGQARPYDCVGVLVEFHKPPGLAFFGLQRELGETLGVPVHLSTKDGLWPQRAERIMSELVEV